MVHYCSLYKIKLKDVEINFLQVEQDLGKIVFFLHLPPADIEEKECCFTISAVAPIYFSYLNIYIIIDY